MIVTNQHEDARLKSLRTYRVLDTEPAAAYDALARLAASVCGTPIALIALVDETRVWFKANVGLERLTELPRADAFCNETIRGAGILEVADARRDERFVSNPLVAGEPAVRFYAGAPLVAADGNALGALSVAGRRARSLTPIQREQLRFIAQLVIDELERRKLLLHLTEGFANLAELTHASLGAPRPGTAARLLIDAVTAATGDSASLLRRAGDGTYGTVPTLDATPLPGGRAPSLKDGFRLENAPDDELAWPIPTAGPIPEFVLVVRYGNRRPDESDRAVLDLVASSFAVGVRNVALYAEAERRRVELLDARATQAELVARLARDVRGPVTSIIGFSRLLEEDERFPPDAREALAVVRACGEHVAEIASDIDLLSRIELAAVEPQWRAVDPARLLIATGASLVSGRARRIVADPDLLGAAFGRLVEDGSRAAAPVTVHLEDLGEAVAIEFCGTGASPDDPASPTIGVRLTARSAERHGGSYRAGGSAASWWIRVTLPADASRAQRQIRVLLLSGGESADFAEQLRSMGFAVSSSATASELRRAAEDTDVVVLPVALGTWAGIDRLPDALRRRIGLVALTTGEVLGTQRWDATVAAPALPTDLRAAIYAAAAKARLRRAEGSGAAAKG